MRLKTISILFIVSSLAVSTTGCIKSYVFKDYQPPKGQPTAKLVYDLPDSVFYADKELSDKGFVQRLDISFQNHKVIGGNGEFGDTIYMSFAEQAGKIKKGVSKELNLIEAGKPITIVYSHQGARVMERVSLCVAKIKTTLQANQTYIITGNTDYDPKLAKKEFLKPTIRGTNCQLKIIDFNSKKVVADSGIVNQ